MLPEPASERHQLRITLAPFQAPLGVARPHHEPLLRGDEEADRRRLQLQRVGDDPRRVRHDLGQLEQLGQRFAQIFYGGAIVEPGSVERAVHEVLDQAPEWVEREGQHQDEHHAQWHVDTRREIRDERRRQQQDPGVRAHDDGAQGSVDEPLADEPVDVEEIVLHDRVGDGQEEERYEEHAELHGNPAAAERIVDEHGEAQDRPGDDAEEDDAQPRPHERIRVLAVRRDRRGEEEDKARGDEHVVRVQREEVGRIAEEAAQLRQRQRGADRVRYRGPEPPSGDPEPVHGEDERQVDERRRKQRLRHEVEAGENGEAGLVKEHREGGEEPADECRPEVDARGTRRGLQEDDGDGRAQAEEADQEEHAVDLDPIAQRERSRRDLGLENGAGLPERVAEPRAGRPVTDSAIDVPARAYRLAVDRHDLRVEQPCLVRWPIVPGDRGDDGVLHEEEPGKGGTDPERAPVRGEDGERNRDHEAQRRAPLRREPAVCSIPRTRGRGCADDFTARRFPLPGRGSDLVHSAGHATCSLARFWCQEQDS